MTIQNWNPNYKLSAGLAFLLIIWMATGLFSASDDDTDEQKREREFSVQAQASKAQRYNRSIFVRGRSEANRSVFVSAEQDGLVADTPATEGQLTNAGAPLCILDSEDRELRLDQAKAQRDKAEIDYQGALQLKDRGFQSRAQIAAAKANLAVAEAELKAATVSRDKLVIRAPFDGVVQERLVDAGGFIQRGSHCARLLELSPLIFVGQLSETDIVSLSVGDIAKVTLLSGETIEGRLRYKSRSANSATRTFKIEVEVDNASMTLVDGMSADLTIYTEELMAHRMNSSLLSLMPNEKIGVKTLDPNNRVEVIEVQVVGDADNGVWVTGLPEEVRLITVGQEYVSEGSVVSVANQEQEAGPTMSTGSLQ